VTYFYHTGKGGAGMKVFISWSGEGSTSHEVALFLRDSMPGVLHDIDAYVSSEDILKGEPWFQVISGELKNSEFGIICVTKENLESPWLNFELGALHNKFDLAHVSPLLINFSAKELQGPLKQFQSTQTNKEDMYKLFNSLNQKFKKPVKEQYLKESFETLFWPKFQKKLKELLFNQQKEANKPLPSDRELLNEVLDISRENIQVQQERLYDLKYALESISNGHFKKIEENQEKMERSLKILEHLVLDFSKISEVFKNERREMMDVMDKFLHELQIMSIKNSENIEKIQIEIENLPERILRNAATLLSKGLGNEE
jgi:hypothetical protein